MRMSAWSVPLDLARCVWSSSRALSTFIPSSLFRLINGQRWVCTTEAVFSVGRCRALEILRRAFAVRLASHCVLPVNELRFHLSNLLEITVLWRSTVLSCLHMWLPFVGNQAVDALRYLEMIWNNPPPPLIRFHCTDPPFSHFKRIMW